MLFRSRSISPHHLKGRIHQKVDNLADLFAQSPFRGLNMDFDRDKDIGRDIVL